MKRSYKGDKTFAKMEDTVLQMELSGELEYPDDNSNTSLQCPKCKSEQVTRMRGPATRNKHSCKECGAKFYPPKRNVEAIF